MSFLLNETDAQISSLIFYHYVVVSHHFLPYNVIHCIIVYHTISCHLMLYYVLFTSTPDPNQQALFREQKSSPPKKHQKTTCFSFASGKPPRNTILFLPLRKNMFEFPMASYIEPKEGGNLSCLSNTNKIKH